MKKTIKTTLFILLISKCVCAQPKQILTQSLRLILSKIVALDKNDSCLLKLPSTNFLDYSVMANKTGFYLSSVMIITLKLNNEYLCQSTKFNNPQVGYMVAVFPNGKIFKLKGFENNDYLYFFLAIKKLSNDLLTKKEFLNEYRVSGVDFQCLDKAFKVLASSKSIDMDQIKQKYNCLKACNDLMILQ